MAFVNECNKKDVSVMEESGVVKESDVNKESELSKEKESKKDNKSPEITEEPRENESTNETQPVPTTPTKRSSLSATHTPILESRLSAKKRSSHMTTPESTKKRKVVQSDSDSPVCCQSIHRRRSMTSD